MNTIAIPWSPAIPGKFAHSNELSVWCACLDISLTQLENLSQILSADELDRAARFRFKTDHKRFIAARGMLRVILGKYLGMAPGKICFEYTAHGKPFIATEPGNDNLCFNLSHSGELALYAFAPGRNVGVDIEQVRDDISIEQIARNFFSQDEITLLEQIEGGKRSGLFFQYWTRKEAILKAMGAGISFPMENCNVSFINEGVRSPVSLGHEKNGSAEWHVQDLFPGTGYAAAIAAEGGDWDLSCCQFYL